VRAGTLVCTHCSHRAAVADGIADLLHEPPPAVTREAAGLMRFAEVMRRDGWDRERILRLPDEPSPYWDGQRVSFGALQRVVDFSAGDRLLDVGSNTCWASAAFARRGLSVVALDIAPHTMQGLQTADWWMERDGTHFERVLGTMFDMPLASETLDHVFCCEVLHHNSLPNLVRTFREAHRVLKPSGVLSVIRETLRAPLRPQLHPGHEVAEFEGNEHAFLAATYVLAARAAGFSVRVLEPEGHWVLSNQPFALTGQRRRAQLKLTTLDVLRRRARSRRAIRGYLHHVAGTVPLSFIARKA
jgi:SAM-dependent methyltransferase